MVPGLLKQLQVTVSGSGDSAVCRTTDVASARQEAAEVLFGTESALHPPHTFACGKRRGSRSPGLLATAHPWLALR